jgi:hypothetical protein
VPAPIPLGPVVQVRCEEQSDNRLAHKNEIVKAHMLFNQMGIFFMG